MLTMILLAFSAVSVSAYYTPGETLNPSCAPGDSGCDVLPATGIDLGDTDFGSYAVGDLLYASGPTTLTTLGIGVDGQILKVDNGALIWGTSDGGSAGASGGDLLSTKNLSDLTNTASARINLNLGNVENTALSTWTGSLNITKVGTIGTGTWNGTAISDAYVSSGLEWNTAYGWGDHSGEGYLTTIGNQNIDALQNVLAMTETDDDLLFYNATGWDSLSHGTDGQTLQYTTASGLGWINSGSADFADGGEAGGADRTLGNTDNFGLALLTNNQERLQIAQNGNVNINATSGHLLRGQSDGGIIDLEVYGYNSDSILRLTTGYNENEAIIKFGTEGKENQGWAFIGQNTTNNYRLDIASGVDIGYHTDGEGSPVLTILQDGRVGIGTTNPSAKLDVECSTGGAATIGDSSNTATGEFAIAMGSNTSASEDYTLATGYHTSVPGRYSSAFGSHSIASGRYAMAIGNASNAAGHYSFTGGRNMQPSSGNGAFVWGHSDTSQSFAPADNRFLIFPQGDAGRVGIGTSSPDAPLHVLAGSAITPSTPIPSVVSVVGPDEFEERNKRMAY